jgi:hypothetical protein
VAVQDVPQLRQDRRVPLDGAAAQVLYVLE